MGRHSADAMSNRVGGGRWVCVVVAVAAIAAGVVSQGGQLAAAATGTDSWFTVNVPAPNGLNDVAFGNGTYVASDIRNAEYSDAYWTSPDGVTWTARRFPLVGKFESVGFAGGQFVLFGFQPGQPIQSFAAVSADGFTWRTAPLALTAGVWDVAHGNGTYVAVGGQPVDGTTNISYLLRSTDGLTWTQQFAGVSAPWLSVAFGNGTFVVGTAYVGGAQPVLTSTNGVNWTVQAGERPLAEIAFGNGVFVGVGREGGVSTSMDGATWVDRPAIDARRWTGVTYGSGKFVATTYTGANPVMTSVDGITWTANVAPQGSWSQVAAGASSFVAIDYDPPGRALVSVASTPTPPQSLRYVALGDSYSSGEGAGAGTYFQTDGKDIKCHRAPSAWSFVVARSLTQIADDMENAACSGALTKHVLRDWFKDEQPQVRRLQELNAKRTVDLVTLTIGGNDAGFGGLVRDCYTSDCAVDAGSGDWRAKAREAARKTAQEIVPALRSAAPKAQIVLVGYPRLLPTSHKSVVNCGWLTSSERIALNALVDTLNQMFKDAVTTEAFEKPGYIAPQFITPTNALDGHELCTRDSHVVKVYGNPKNSEQAHPNPAGQRDYARAVVAGLKSLGVVTG